ncbi:MAG: lldD [Proteobacteria bacterium]|nr:lldD [Pseudomonadota bacterium]
MGNDIGVHFDGGIRSGQDVALGGPIKGTYIGRSMLYGLGAMGEEGITMVLNIIRNEFDLSMAFCGKTHVASIDARLLRRRLFD